MRIFWRTRTKLVIAGGSRLDTASLGSMRPRPHTLARHRTLAPPYLSHRRELFHFSPVRVHRPRSDTHGNKLGHSLIRLKANVGSIRLDCPLNAPSGSHRLQCLFARWSRYLF